MADPPELRPAPSPDIAGISFRDQGYATQNRNIRPKSYKPVRTPNYSPMGEISNALNDRTKNYEAEGVINFVARVLRVENRNNDNQDEGGALDWISSLFSDSEIKQAPVQITAIIDADIHSMAWGNSGVGHPDFVLPNESGQGGSPNASQILNKLASYSCLFTAEDTGTPVPNINELVLVTFGDMANRREGVYLKPLIARDNNQTTADNAGPAGAGGSAGQNGNSNSAPCNKLKSKRPKGRKTRNKNASYSSTS